jgi:hypothetical protein
MISLHLTLFFLLLIYTTTVLATCVLATDIGIGGTFYYAPSDGSDFSFYYQGTGCTGADATTPAQISQPDGTVLTCGTLTLDGGEHLFNCPGLIRGTMQVGAYTINHPISTGTFYETFTITHTQVTVVAPTSTDTVTTTPSKFYVPYSMYYW